MQVDFRAVFLQDSHLDTTGIVIQSPAELAFPRLLGILGDSGVAGQAFGINPAGSAQGEICSRVVGDVDKSPVFGAVETKSGGVYFACKPRPIRLGGSRESAANRCP